MCIYTKKNHLERYNIGLMCFVFFFLPRGIWNFEQAFNLGLTSFFTLAIMLSLLVFVGEAIRDSLDPRKTFIKK